MLTKRIIPCLDIKNGRTTKGINFENLRDAGDPIELASIYSEQGADELVFLDISATQESRETVIELADQVAACINIPFTVGGGISSIDQVYRLLRSGADKVSINSAAVYRPDLIDELTKEFGSQCIVVAIDARQVSDTWTVYTSGGKKESPYELYSWAKEVQARGAGEILFTSMNHDGTKNGFALDALAKLNQELAIPVIASGGAGAKEHFYDAFHQANADAALAASVFHFNEISIPELKSYLKKQNIPIR
ncbi:MAG: imidazole glycerol phosphate synthase subunit HisF [Bacteroidota bacterium]